MLNEKKDDESLPNKRVRWSLEKNHVETETASSDSFIIVGWDTSDLNQKAARGVIEISTTFRLVVQP